MHNNYYACIIDFYYNTYVKGQQYNTVNDKS